MSRYQQSQHHQNSPRSSHAWRIQDLDRRRFAISVEMTKLRAEERSLHAKWQMWYGERQKHDHEKGRAFVQSMASLFGAPALFPSAQAWQVKDLNLQRAYQRLFIRGSEIFHQLIAYEHELYLIDLEIDLLSHFP